MSDHYNQAELAILYDDENGWDASADFYRDLALRTGAKTLLDLGCGTGTVTRGILRAIGGSGVGADPAAPMLDIARRNTTAKRSNGSAATRGRCASAGTSISSS